MSVSNTDDTFDSISDPVLYIPFSQDDPLEDENGHQEGAFGMERDGIPSNPYPDLIPSGPQLRFEAYREAWHKCLHRVKELVKAMHRPVVGNLVDFVKKAYKEDELEGLLSYPEIPTALVTGGEQNTLLDSLVRELDQYAFICRLSEPDFSNMTNVMKSLVTGFIGHDKDPPKRKMTASLANFDMRLLRVWYNSLEVSEHLHRLVILLQDFDSLDPALVQDLFYICSLHIPDLPLVFICGGTSAETLRAVYPRKFFTLIRVTTVTIPNGLPVFEGLIQGTYFDPHFSPDVMIGPTAFKSLRHNFVNYNPLVDSFLSHLQLVHLAHFRNPVSVFSASSLLGMDSIDEAIILLLEPTNRGFVDHLRARLHNFPAAEEEAAAMEDWATSTPETLLQLVTGAREDFQSQATNYRISLNILWTIQKVLKRQYQSSTNLDKQLVDFFEEVLDGKLKYHANALCRMVKKLPVERLRELLSDIHDFLLELPSDIIQPDINIQAFITNSLKDLPDANIDEVETDIATEIGTWLNVYFKEKLSPLDETTLWDAWYTRNMIMPMDLLNPSPHSAVVAALVQPSAILDQYQAFLLSPEKGKSPKKANTMSRSHHNSREILDPDTCILFQRYLESGKTINLYDWYESFVNALASEMEAMTTASESTSDSPKKRRQRERMDVSPTKTPGRPLEKGKISDTPTRRGGRRSEYNPEALEDAEKDEKTEEWRREVQARFMRSLHELDFLGFIRWTGRGTGRKGAECVGKVVWRGAD